MGNHPAFVWSAGVEPHKPTMGPPCLLFPSPVQVLRCRTAFLCYACFVPMGPAAYGGPSPSFGKAGLFLQEVRGQHSERSIPRHQAFAIQVGHRHQIGHLPGIGVCVNPNSQRRARTSPQGLASNARRLTLGAVWPNALRLTVSVPYSNC